MRSVAGKVGNLAANMGFQAWLDFVDLQQSLRRLLQRVVNREQVCMSTSLQTQADAFHAVPKMLFLLSCTQALAYDRWAETAEATKAKRTKLVEMVTRITQGKVVAAWNSWTDMVSAHERSRAALERGLRMLPGSVGHAWNSWIEVYNEQRQKGKVMQKFVLKLMNRASALAFESWAELAAEEGAKKARMVRKRQAFDAWIYRFPRSQGPACF